MYPQDPTQQPVPLQPSDPTQSSQPLQPREKHAVRNPLEVMQPGEHIICQIKRHPIGMLGIYIGSGFLLIILAVVAFVVIPNFMSSGNRGQGLALGGLLFIFLGALLLGFVFISNKIYWGNSWVLTTDSLTQILQTSLFKRQSSQLSLGNLEDVTAEQNGLLPRMFNYGLLRVETAGERSKFMFYYCPNPNYYAQQILSARELFEQGRQHQQQSENPQGLYRPAGSYTDPYQNNPQPSPGPGQPEPTNGPQPTYAIPTPPNPVPNPGFNPAPPPPPTYPPNDIDQGVNIDTQ